MVGRISKSSPLKKKSKDAPGRRSIGAVKEVVAQRRKCRWFGMEEVSGAPTEVVRDQFREIGYKGPYLSTLLGR